MITRYVFVPVIIISLTCSQARSDVFDDIWGFIAQLLPGGNQDDTQNDSSADNDDGLCTIVCSCYFKNSDGEWVEGIETHCVAGNCDECIICACSNGT